MFRSVVVQHNIFSPKHDGVYYTLQICIYIYVRMYVYIYMCVYMYIYIYVCMYVCMYVFIEIQTGMPQKGTLIFYIYIYIYIYIYMCVCVLFVHVLLCYTTLYFVTCCYNVLYFAISYQSIEFCTMLSCFILLSCEIMHHCYTMICHIPLFYLIH